MTNGFIKILLMLFSLLIPSFTGYLFITALFKRARMGFPVMAALSYGIGLGILTQTMLLLGMFRIPYTLFSIYTPIALVSLACGIFIYKRKDLSGHSFKQKLIFPKLTQIEKIILAVTAVYLIGVLIFIFWKALNIPIYTWDAIAAVAFKAKVFFYERSISYLKNLCHPSYPLHVTFLETWGCINLGEWDDQTIKIIFPFVFLSFTVLLAYFIRTYTNRLWMLLGTLIFISSNFPVFHATISYRDLFLMYYTSGTILFLIHWNRTENDDYLIISSILAGFATFTKLEGTAYLSVFTLLLAAMLFFKKSFTVKRKMISALKFIIPAFFICAYYHVYKIVAHLTPEKIFYDFSIQNLARIPLIMKTFFYDMFFTGNWNITWFILLISICTYWNKLKNNAEARYSLLALFLFLGFYTANGLLTQNFLWIGGTGTLTTISRLVLHFYPLTIFLVAVLNHSEE